MWNQLGFFIGVMFLISAVIESFFNFRFKNIASFFHTIDIVTIIIMGSWKMLKQPIFFSVPCTEFVPLGIILTFLNKLKSTKYNNFFLYSVVFRLLFLISSFLFSSFLFAYLPFWFVDAKCKAVSLLFFILFHIIVEFCLLAFRLIIYCIPFCYLVIIFSFRLILRFFMGAISWKRVQNIDMFMVC